MVDLLWPAHDEACEAELAALIAEDLAAGRLPDAGQLKPRLAPRHRPLPADVPVALTPLASFDALLEMRALPSPPPRRRAPSTSTRCPPC
jgi:hypothetical protein